MIIYQNTSSIIVTIVKVIKSLAFIVGALLLYNYANMFMTTIDPAQKEAFAPFVLLLATVFAIYIFWIKEAKSQFKSFVIDEEKRKIILAFHLKKEEIPFIDLKYKKNIKNEEEFQLDLYNKEELFFRFDNNNLENIWIEEIQEIISFLMRITSKK
jgi:hypothetical protein